VRVNTTVDLACLVKVEELEITGMTIKNYNCLRNLKKASFASCGFYHQDINCFSNLSSLKLINIGTFLDIIPLNKVPILKFERCRNLSGWSSLGKSRELRCCITSGNVAFGDVSHLRNVEKLSLHHFKGGLSPLQNVIVLDLSYSYSLRM
jgi:hypothetical protein